MLRIVASCMGLCEGKMSCFSEDSHLLSKREISPVLYHIEASVLQEVILRYGKAPHFSKLLYL